MIEFRKKSIVEDYNRLCIIDVHKHIGSNRDSKLKKIIKKRVPDFVIIDPKSDSLCGCVEIKKTTPNKSLKLQVGSFYIDTIKYNFEITSTLKDKTHKIPYDLSSEEDKNSIVAQIQEQILKEEIPNLDSKHISKPTWNSSRNANSKKFFKKFCHVDITTSMDAQTILDKCASDSKEISFTSKDPQKNNFKPKYNQNRNCRFLGFY